MKEKINPNRPGGVPKLKKKLIKIIILLNIIINQNIIRNYY